MRCGDSRLGRGKVDLILIITLNKNIMNKNENPINESAFDFIINEFKKESDRAAVILIAAIFDEKLTTLLKATLVPIPTSKDDFFDGVNAPISTFSSKIDLSYRLGLISPQFTRDLHLIRKIRNILAHDIYDCNFENKSIKSRIMELSKSCTMIPFYEHLINVGNKKVEKGVRGVFLFITTLMIVHLEKLIEVITPLESVEFISEESIYQDAEIHIEEHKKIINKRKKK